MSQNETFPAKQGSPSHGRERLHHLLRESGFSFSESQTSCFITSGFSDSSCVVRSSVPVELERQQLTHPQMQSSARKHSKEQALLQDTNPGCHHRAWVAPHPQGSEGTRGSSWWDREERKPSESRGALGEEDSSTGLLSLLLHTRNLLLPDTAQQVLDIY